MEEMGNDLISVIIPVYNVEPFIEKCIKSVMEQTYLDILEIVLIDDGSTDESGKICDQYAERNEKVRVIHKQNGGLSDARNCGLYEAKGNLIAFIDSDDYVANDYIEYLYKLLKQYNADVSICSKKKFHDGDVIQKFEESSEIKIYTGIAAMEDLLYQKRIENSAWGKLYKASLFEGIGYPLGMLYEDLGTTYKVLFKAKAVIWGSSQKYYYLQRNSSIMKKKFSANNMDRVVLSKELLEFVDRKCNSIHKAAISRFFISNTQVLKDVPLCENEYYDIICELKENIRRYRKEVLLDKNAKKINRFIALCSYAPIYVLQKLGRINNWISK